MRWLRSKENQRTAGQTAAQTAEKPEIMAKTNVRMRRDSSWSSVSIIFIAPSILAVTAPLLESSACPIGEAPAGFGQAHLR
jgi:hypothetical protein